MLGAGPCILLALSAAAIVHWQLRLVGDFRIDDAYISFAFAKNLALGKGLVYGHDLRVEGYSNFLWVVFCAVLKLFAPNGLYNAARVANLACLAMMMVFAFRIARLHANVFLSSVVVLLLASATDLARAAQSGLETVAFVAALTGTAWLYLRESPALRRISGYGLLTLSLLRIDGIALAAFIVAYDVLWSLIEGRFSFRALLSWLAVPALVYASYFAWRYSYYRLLLPTPFYAKASLGMGAQYQGLSYVWSGALDLGLPVLFALAIFTCGRRLTSPKCFLVMLTTAQLVYIAHVGGDWMPFNRFLLLLLPLLAVLFVWGIGDLLAAVSDRSRWARFPVIAVAVALTFGVAILQDAHSINTPAERDKVASVAHVAQHTAGLVQARGLYQWVLRSPGETLVTDYGGVFAYFTDASIIEMWGLCNRDIALRGNTVGINSIYGKTCIECYKAFNPDYFHLNVPLARPVDSLTNDTNFSALIFQGHALDKVLDLGRNYVTGRVVNMKTNLAFYFLERRRDHIAFETRKPAPDIVVEYPFLDRKTL